MRGSALPFATLAMAASIIGAFGAPTRAAACTAETDSARTAEPYASRLPDCRVYEQVSPVQKNTSDAIGGPRFVHSSPSGESVSYYSIVPFPGIVNASEFPTYLSMRTGGSWSMQGLNAPTESGGESNVFGLTEDNGEALDHVGPEIDERFLLAPGAELEVGNTYVHDNATGQYRLLATRPRQLYYVDSTPDGSHILFTSTKPELVPGVVDENEQPYLYEWSRESGQSVFVGYVNGKTPEGGTVAGSNEKDTTGESANAQGVAYDQNTISENGARIFFSENGEQEKLYMREPSAERTVAISKEAAQWKAATPDGSNAFYTESGNLYEFDAGSATSTAITSGASKVVGMVGISRDGSYAYFVAEEVLAANKSGEKTAQAGAPNLYEWHAGATPAITFVATFAPTPHVGLSPDVSDWTGYAEPVLAGSEDGFKDSRVSTTGTRVLISSVEQVTNYKNAGAQELYLYDAPSGGLVCVSCFNPTNPGQEPKKNTTSHTTSLSEANGHSSPTVSVSSPFMTRNLSAEGTRVFFDSEEALLPQANGQVNVYEWEQEGTGSCGVEEGDENGGCLSLISNGQSTTGAYFGDAGESGEDVFFFTRQSLVGQDTDQNVDLYDARANGGIAAQSPALRSPACVGEEACRGSESSSGPAFSAPPSATFSGAGNLAPPAPAPVEPEATAKTEPKLKPPSRAQKLAAALRACAKRPGKQRARCKAQARKRYGRKANKSDWGEGR